MLRPKKEARPHNNTFQHSIVCPSKDGKKTDKLSLSRRRGSNLKAPAAKRIISSKYRDRHSMVTPTEIRCSVQVFGSVSSSPKALNAFFFFCQLYFADRTTMVLGDYRMYSYKLLFWLTVTLFCNYCNFSITKLLFHFSAKI